MKKSIGRKVLFLAAFMGIVVLLIIISNVAALDLIDEYNTRISNDVEQYVTAAGNDNEETMMEIEQDFNYILQKSATKIRGTYIFDIILIVVAILMIGVVVFVILKTISGPAKNAYRQLGTIVGRIQEGRGDLTQRIAIKNQDEIGQLAGGINGFIDNLQGLVRKLQQETDALMQSAGRVIEQVGNSNESASNVSATMEELSASMEEVSATLEQIASGSEEVFQEVKNMSSRADEGARMVVEVRNRAGAVRNRAVESKEAAGGIIAEIKDMLEQAVEESRSVEKINELTDDILDITGQTNLLALNASIEAARAGEMGKGFAVVADEIRVLADGSRETANNIQGISNMVTTAVNKLASNAQQMLKFVDENVIKDYDDFVDVANQYQADADSMNDILSTFAEKADGIEMTMQTMNTGLNDISVTVDESARGVASVAESAVSLVEAISGIKDESDHTRKVSENLLEEVKRFENV